MNDTNRAIKSIIDTSDDSIVDMSYIGKEIWVAHLDTDRVFENLKLINIPLNVTDLRLGTNLSKSIISPLVLPPFLNTYEGPIIDKMEIPETLRTISIIETNDQICFSNIKLPPGINSLTLTPKDNLTTLEHFKLPSGLEYFKINEPFNSSIDNLNMENLQLLKSVILPDSFLQPFQLSGKDVLIERKELPFIPVEFKDNHYTENNKIINSTPLVNDAIRKYLPSLNHLKINLSDDISHVWFNILLEGKVEVKTLSVNSMNQENVLKNIGLVFDRSYKLNRRFCKRLIIDNITFEENTVNSYLNLARSLNRIGNILIVLNHINTPNLHGVTKRMASIMKMGNLIDGVYSSLFGAIESTIRVDNNSIVINKGHIPRHFEPPVVKKEDEVSPTSSSLVVPIEDIVDLHPPPMKNIKLVSWTKCMFCKKQDEIIESMKEELGNLLDEKIEIETVDDPSNVSDDRVKSFPSWIINDVIEPGVKSEEEIKKIIGIEQTSF